MLGSFSPLPLDHGGRSRPTRPTVTTQSEPSQRGDSSVLARTAVSLEYASLRHTGHCPLGIYVVPSASNLLVWDAVFFVHQGEFTSKAGWQQAYHPFSRILCGFYTQVSFDLSFQLSRRFTGGGLYNGRLPPIDLFHWFVQLGAPLQAMEVIPNYIDL